MELLNKYLNMTIPLEYRELKKTVLQPVTTSLLYNNIEIKVKAELVFRTTDSNGSTIIGACKYNNAKTEPHLTPKGMSIVSALLYMYLEKHVAKEGEIVVPELCMCLDVFQGKFRTAPTGSDVPNRVMRRIAEEFIAHWNS